MRLYALGLLSALGLAAGVGGMTLVGQSLNTAESHVSAAKAAAGTDHLGLFGSPVVVTYFGTRT